MLIGSLIGIIKLTSLTLGNEMVTSATRRLASNLFYVGRQFVTNYMQNEGNQVDGPNSGANSQSTEYLVHNWLEASFAWFQMAILWHNPTMSIIGLSGFLSLFLLLTYFAPRFYATIFIAIFCYNLIIVWFRHIWPEIRVPPGEELEEESRLDVDRWTHLHPQLMTINELGQLTNNFMKASELQLQKLLELRRDEPVKFCLIICSILSCTAIIGGLIDGPDLLFFTTTALLLAPGIYLHLLPIQAKEYLRRYINISNNQSISPINNAPEQQESSSQPTSQSQSSLSLPTLSLFDHLKLNSSYLLGQQESTTPTTSETKANTNLEQPMEVPIANENLSQERGEEEEVEAKSKHQQALGEKDPCCHGDSPKGLDDLSSNESTSLIDFEDDQQDGFVIL